MERSSGYVPPRVWTWDKPNGGRFGLSQVQTRDKPNGGRFASINQPVAGARHDKALPTGKHPFQLYSMGTPNGMKASILFEELLARGKPAEYDAWLIDIGEGDQFSTGFVEINPNSKIPALVDRTGNPPVRVFESGAILMHLAETFEAFLPADGAARAECLSWLFWQVGSAPFVGGGFGHFYHYAEEKHEYAINRFTMETKRQLDVLDRRLADHDYVAGSEYTIADIAVWPWYGNLALGNMYDAAEFLSVTDYSHLRRWAEAIAERPAVRRGRIVNRPSGAADEGLRERHEASDFDAIAWDEPAPTAG